MKQILLLIVLMASLQCFSQNDVFNVARSGTVAELKELIKSDPNSINALNKDGYSPLILACYKGNVEVAEFLIKNVKDINYVSGMGTALMAATVKQNVSIVKLLLENKANPNISDANGSTALIYASIFKSYEIVDLLIKHKGDNAHKDNRGNSAIDYAILADDDKLIQILKAK
ncbi:ankyrin repeat domain-containing protein [Flavobacterium amnicola]|uniref:Ankyrin repeat domain-containing protein n=1 Tax=Flavobacterium amnicola TaxID=2506422 RepID=A0A4Q1K137_9FLAO|nr:ankyrin repeat domain-containing protein [Flavobacterium amnicola]RXR17721.1 ankyrin repeat domain-containing protein [Flavobacterium amnicola]